MKEKLESILLAINTYEYDELLNEAHLGNILSLIHQELGEKSWVGIYKYKEDKLILSSFQGTPACEVIKIGKGVVGTSFQEKKTIYFEDVTKIENYICCDPVAKSEICIPLFKNNVVVAIFDIDLPFVHDFSDDYSLFEKVAKAIGRFI